jgi:hypothetical protein
MLHVDSMPYVSLPTTPCLCFLSLKHSASKVNAFCVCLCCQRVRTEREIRSVGNHLLIEPSSNLWINSADPLYALWQNAVEEENDPAISDALQYWAAMSTDPKDAIWDAMFYNVQHQVSYTTRNMR